MGGKHRKNNCLKFIACQAPLCVGCSRQEYRSGLPFPSPEDLPDTGSNPCLLHCRWTLYHLSHQGLFSSVQFSRSVMSNSLRPHELQHARPPYPSPNLGFTQTHVHRVSDAIQPSHPLSPPSPPALNPHQHQSLFQ